MRGLFLLLLLGVPCIWASDTLTFMDLVVTPEGNHIRVTIEPQDYLSFDVINDPTYSIPSDMAYGLDGPFRLLLQIAREMDEKRAKVIAGDLEVDRVVRKNYFHASKRPIDLARFMLTVSLRDLEGNKIDNKRIRLEFQLDKGSGRLHINDPVNKNWTVGLKSLSEREGYLNFLRKVVLPQGSVKLKRPKSDSFLVDLQFSATYVNENLEAQFQLEKSKRACRVLSSLYLFQQKGQLGVTFCYNSQNGMTEVRSGHLKFLRDTMRDYNGALAKSSRGENAMAELEALLDKMPAELLLIEMLVEAYLNNGMENKAFLLLTRMGPLTRKSVRLTKNLAAITERRGLAHQKLLEQRDSFSQDNNIELEILTPSEWDFIGGKANMVFAVHNQISPLLCAELFANGELVGNLDKRPYKFTFQAEGLDRSLELTLRTWFKNRTWQETILPVRNLHVNAEEQIQLVSLRTVVSKGSRFLTDLDAEDFKVTESRSHREIVKFEKDTAPLRIAILMDVSGSMLGEKLFRCQHAVNAFLSKLEPQDKVAIFGFNNRVLKFSGFTNHFTDMRDLLYTMQPQLTTSLNDALLVARNELVEQEGTQVIIVLSDGSDSASKITAEDLYPALANTNVLVHSVVMNDGGIVDREGYEFLKKVSKITGSVTTELTEIKNLDQAFSRIYEELKSFYFIDFYSNQQDFNLDELEISLRWNRGITRFRQHLSLGDLRHDVGVLSGTP